MAQTLAPVGVYRRPGKVIGIVLGSGLANVASRLEIENSTNLEKIIGPDILRTVPPLGHHRRFLKALWNGKKVAVFQGRLHFYEGFSMQVVTEPIRYLKTLGVKTLILTCACGGMDSKMRAGDFIVIQDHIHLQSSNPLRGTTQFIDCTQIYDAEIARWLMVKAKKMKLRAFPGIYASLDGPSYETPAEIRALRRMGANVVGMSLTAEAIMARSLGMRVVGLGWVSNLASGLVSQAKLSHEEVLEMAARIEGNFARLLLALIEHAGE